MQGPQLGTLIDALSAMHVFRAGTLGNRLALSAAVDSFGILEAISLNSFSQPEATLRLLPAVSTPQAKGQPALAPPVALGSRFAVHSYRNATDGSTLIAFRAGK
jgi:hypothetical protein